MAMNNDNGNPIPIDTTIINSVLIKACPVVSLPKENMLDELRPTALIPYIKISPTIHTIKALVKIIANHSQNIFHTV
jgi:hypothetical protein